MRKADPTAHTGGTRAIRMRQRPPGNRADPQRPHRRWSAAFSLVASAVAVPCWGLSTAAGALLTGMGPRSFEGPLLADETPERHFNNARGGAGMRLRQPPPERESRGEPAEDDASHASGSLDDNDDASAGDATASEPARKQTPELGHRKSEKSRSAVASSEHMRAASDAYDNMMASKSRHPLSAGPTAPPYAEDPFPHLGDRYTRITNDTVKREVEAMVRAEALRAVQKVGEAGTAPNTTASSLTNVEQEPPGVPYPDFPSIGSAQQVTYVPMGIQTGGTALPVAIYPTGALPTPQWQGKTPSHTIAAAVPLVSVDVSSGAGRVFPPNAEAWGTGYTPVMGRGLYPKKGKPYLNRTDTEAHTGSAHAKVLALGATCLVGAAAGACVLTTCLKKGRALEREPDSWVCENTSLPMDSRTKTEDVYHRRSESHSDLQIVGMIPTTTPARF